MREHQESKSIKTEEYVAKTNKGRIYGKCYLPGEEEIRGAVILSHGYNGSHVDFDLECRSFAENGYLACAYDFRGGSLRSKSTGLSTTEMTIFTEKEDLLTVVEDLSSRPMVQGKRLFLFGGSQGGFVTAMALEDLQEKVAAAALYYPAFCIPEDWRRAFSSVEDIPRTLEVMGMPIGRSYFEAIRDVDAFDLVGTYRNPLLIIHGDRDEIVPLSVVRQAVEKYPAANLEILEGQGHGFSREGCRKAMELILQKFSRLN